MPGLTSAAQVSVGNASCSPAGAAPLTAAGPPRWVPPLGGYQLAGGHLPTQDPSETRR